MKIKPNEKTEFLSIFIILESWSILSTGLLSSNIKFKKMMYKCQMVNANKLM